MTRQGGFGAGGWRNLDTGPGPVGKFMRSSAAVPLFLVGGLAAVVVTAGAVSLYEHLNQEDDTGANATGTGASFGDTNSTSTGYSSGYHGTGYWGGGGFGSSGNSHPASGGGTSRGGFGGTGHGGGGS